MRVLIISCLLATSLAIPQGYNYQKQQLNSLPLGIPHTATHSGSSLQHNGLQDGQNFIQQAFQSPKLTQTLIGGGQNFIKRPQPSHFSHLVGIGAQIQPQYQQNYNRPASPPVVTKDIFVHAAPEEPQDRYAQQPLPVLPPRKHYRIVFIKAPTQKASSAALRVQQAPSEEKTIIYVLTKKPDPLDLESAIQEVPQNPPSKPEVYFIKYKTQEEAQHAQRAIQAQYDKLGGTTQVSDEGVAPITSVIGSLDQQQNSSGSSSYSSSSSGSNNGGLSATYGAPLNTGSSSGGSSSSNVSNEKEYLPPIRL